MLKEQGIQYLVKAKQVEGTIKDFYQNYLASFGGWDSDVDNRRGAE